MQYLALMNGRNSGSCGRARTGLDEMLIKFCFDFATNFEWKRFVVSDIFIACRKQIL